MSLALDFFDKIISPILLYGSEIWGTRYAGSIEYVDRKFCKYVLNVSINASNAAVLGELGRRPLICYVLKNLDDV